MSAMQNRSFQRMIAESMREIIFGLEDSIVSTLGALTGIAVGTQSSFVVILSGLVLLSSEGMSMAAGSYLSSKSAFETEKFLLAQDSQVIDHKANPIRAGIVMGFCYFLGGLVPLTPYFFFSISTSLIISIPLSALILFLVGVWSSAFTKRSAIRSGVEMLVISLSAALIGFMIARTVSLYWK